MEQKENIRQKLLKSQQEISAIKKDSMNPHFKNTYFDINSILAEVKPVLNKNGLFLIQELISKEFNSGVKTGIETTIYNVENEEKLSAFVEIPTVPDPQKIGSAVTYFRRYALQSMLALEAEDDDGNVASGKKSTEPKYVKTKAGGGTVDPKSINPEDEPF